MTEPLQQQPVQQPTDATIADNGLPVVLLSRADHKWLSKVALQLRIRNLPEVEVLRILTDAAGAFLADGRPAKQVLGGPVPFSRQFPKGSTPWRPGRKLVVWLGAPMVSVASMGLMNALDGWTFGWVLVATCFPGAVAVMTHGQSMDSELPPHLLRGPA